ncbi:MAG: DUF1566 domain-containing protein [Myxococcales bacterium]|nr:DUF1566 domain-containing protein [Myxococcales bacterium]
MRGRVVGALIIGAAGCASLAGLGDFQDRAGEGGGGAPTSSSSSSGGVAGGGSAGGSGGSGGSGGTGGASPPLGPGWPDSSTAHCITGEAGGASSPCDDTVPSPQDGHHTDLVEPELAFSTEVLTDGLTTLQWTRGGEGAGTWAEAEVTCQNRGADWRLPSALEMTSVADYGESASVFGTSLLLLTGSLSWLSNEDTTDPGYAWVMTAGGSWVSVDKSLDRLVVCVRGALPAPDGVVDATTYTDRTTRLMWRSTSEGPSTWAEAIPHCATQHGPEWRLPTIKELVTVVDFEAPQLRGGIAPVFTNLWSSTPSREQSHRAWVLAPSLPAIFVNDIDLQARILCVRSL